MWCESWVLLGQRFSNLSQPITTRLPETLSLKHLGFIQNDVALFCHLIGPTKCKAVKWVI